MSPKEKRRISIILPCLNEELGIKKCLVEIDEVIRENKINAEIIVVDNNSTDNSEKIVKSLTSKIQNLKLVKEEIPGYGSAYLRGAEESTGDYLFFSDADYSYDFKDIPDFIRKLDEGNDVVIGDRFSQKLNKGVMPWHHQYIGNPILSFLVRIFFKTKIKDVHCGKRAMTREAFNTISPQTTGMEFASEIVIKAAKNNLKFAEIPIIYRERIGESKLNSLRDGWRHLRFILIYSPTILFLLPGLILFILGTILTTLMYFTNPNISGIQLYFHPMFISSIMMIVGYQFIFFAGFARIYAITHLNDKDKRLEKLFRYITIERAGTLGIFLTTIGVGILIYIFNVWTETRFGSSDQIKNSIVALIAIVIGVQTVSSSFMLSMLSIKEK